MRSFTPSSFMRSLLVAVVAASLAPTGCKKESDSGRRSPPTVSVASVPWGDEANTLGRFHEVEGTSIGPGAFVVDEDGTIFVLDRANDRIQAISNGSVRESVPLPEGTFVDLDLFPPNGFVLLDAYNREQLVYLSGSGEVLSEVPLLSDEVEPSEVTGIDQRSDGTWVEIDCGRLVRVTDENGAEVTPRTAVAGRFTADGESLLRTTFDPEEGLILWRQPRGGGAPQQIAQPQFDGMASRLLFEADSSGRLLLGVTVDMPSDTASDTESDEIKQDHILVVLSPDGSEISRTVLEGPTAHEEVYRPVRLGKNGKVYAMIPSQTGVEIYEVAR